METEVGNRCHVIWLSIWFVFGWGFLWFYAIFLAPISFKLIADVGQTAWTIADVPHYSLFPGSAASLTMLFVHVKNLKKLKNGVGGSPTVSVVAISLVYLIPMLIFLGEAATMLQTAVVIPLKH